MPRQLTRALIFIPALSLAAACGDDPVTAEDVGSRTGTLVSGIVQNSGSVLEGLEDLQTLEQFTAALENLSLVEDDVPVPPDGDDSGLGMGTEDELDADEAAQEIERFLSEVIFTEQNLESADESSATFLLGASLCDQLAGGSEITCDQSGCVEEPEDPAECRDALARLEIRIKAELIGDDGVDLTLQIGPNRASPLKLELRPTSLATEIDLADIKAALTHFMSVSGEDAELPDTFEGRLRLALSVPQAGSLQLSQSVLSPVAISGEVDEGSVLVQVAAADPLFVLTADTVAETLGVTLDLEQVDITLPYALLTEEPSNTETFGAHLGGASFDVLLDESSESLTITNIGMGNTTSSITLDGAEVIGMDLNETAGRSFTLDVEPTATSAILTVTPMLDLELRMAMSLIESALDPDDEIPSFALNDTLSLTLAGEGSAAIEPLEGAIKVVAGSLTLGAANADGPISVAAGENALLGRDELNPRSDESHELLQLLEAGACP